MNFKVLSAVGISGLLMAGGVLFTSAFASSSGYDLFKTSVKKTQTVNSFTADVNASLSDNGKEIYQVSSVSQMDLKGDASSSSVNIQNGSVSKEVNVYSKDHQEIVKSNGDENYYVKQEGRKAMKRIIRKKDPSPQMQKDIENIFDTLTKNYQDSITSRKLANGITELQLNLSKDQIPAAGQAAVSFFLKNMDHQGQDMERENLGSLKFS